jgi:hypothetical protein
MTLLKTLPLGEKPIADRPQNRQIRGRFRSNHGHQLATMIPAETPAMRETDLKH